MVDDSGLQRIEQGSAPPPIHVVVPKMTPS